MTDAAATEMPVTDIAPEAAGGEDRALLRRGYDPATPLTTRAHDRPYASFKPAPIRLTR